MGFSNVAKKWDPSVTTCAFHHNFIERQNSRSDKVGSEQLDLSFVVE